MKKDYLKEAVHIGLPITIQSILQASYSLVDQLMVGTLGTMSIAGGGLAGKFSTLVSFTVASVAAVTSILVAQYHGNKDEKGVNNSFFSCLYLSLIVAILFVLPCVLIPDRILSIYTSDQEMITTAVSYLIIIGISFIPMTATLQMSALLRSIEHSREPLYASSISMITNIILNYIFIFGKAGAPKLGLAGAGIGTLLSRMIEALILLFVILYMKKGKKLYLHPVIAGISQYKKISVIVLPILLNEFSWSVGENIYAAVYGRISTQAVAAVTLTSPLQGMFIGMFSGLSTAATVMVGKRLGREEEKEAYQISKYLMGLSAAVSVVVGVVLVGISKWYIGLYAVEAEVQEMTLKMIYAIALLLIVKTSNMVLAGGVIRSGGKTQYTLYIDLIGTWIFGVPLALLAAFVFKLPVYSVYLILSQEEVVRLLIGIYFFRKKKWMNNVTKQ